MRLWDLRWHVGYFGGNRWPIRFRACGLQVCFKVWIKSLGARPVALPFRQRAPDIFFYAEGQALSFPGVISASQQVLNTIFLRTGREF
jgi:hypothetical protein